ncbi:hypothetical protein Tco_0035238 [Tanacetum coccineum]
MQFAVHNFDHMNAMYKAFTRKLKDIPLQPTLTNVDPSVIEPWVLDSDDAQPGAIGVTPLTNTVKGKPTANNDFYHEPFLSKESEKDVRDLVASLFTKQIRDYDMPENLHAYDGTTDPNDHLTVFIEILGIRQRPDESLKDYVARFSRETLHMADRSDVLVSRAFISGLRPGCLFKDLIAKPATSLEDYVENVEGGEYVSD